MAGEFKEFLTGELPVFSGGRLLGGREANKGLVRSGTGEKGVVIDTV